MTAPRLGLLTALVMVAFALNSILNRLAVASSAATPEAFALVRVAAGAAVLWALAGRRVGGPARHWAGAATLTLYLVGFSLAYARLDAGLGAMILFGGVQITMFAGALWRGQPVPPRRWAGAAIALVGLGVLLAPTGPAQVSGLGAALMGAAALGWGLYSLIGQGSADPTADTAGNFLWAVPLVALAGVATGFGGAVPTAAGVALAVVSGAATSGLGYALWYAVLPGLRATRGAVAQLSVPLIAVALGALALGEPVTWRLVLAAVLITGGVGLSLLPQRRIGSNGS